MEPADLPLNYHFCKTGRALICQPNRERKPPYRISHTAVSFYERRASRGSVVKPSWNTGPNAAREDMPRKGLNKAERHTRKRRKEEASFLLPHGECGVRGDAPQESLGLPSGPPFPKGEEDRPRDDGTHCCRICRHCRHCRHRFGWWNLPSASVSFTGSESHGVSHPVGVVVSAVLPKGCEA